MRDVIVNFLYNIIVLGSSSVVVKLTRTRDDVHLVLSSCQLTWTGAMCIAAASLEFGENVLVSYLPLSHVAAQLLDIYVPILCGGSVYFAKPDALKV